MEEKTTCLEGGDFLKDWNQWKKTVSQAIQTARNLGMPDQAIIVASTRVGDFLSSRLCAATPEEALIRDLWNVAEPDDRKVLGKLLFKMMDKSPAAAASE
jgi:sulfur relay (sulfurtransferase) DsrC/TusE family protein